MNFSKTIIEAIKHWVNSNFIGHGKQTLTDTQKEQARENIGASNFSGSYEDLSNKPFWAINIGDMNSSNYVFGGLFKKQSNPYNVSTLKAFELDPSKWTETISEATGETIYRYSEKFTDSYSFAYDGLHYVACVSSENTELHENYYKMYCTGDDSGDQYQCWIGNRTLCSSFIESTNGYDSKIGPFCIGKLPRANAYSLPTIEIWATKKFTRIIVIGGFDSHPTINDKFIPSTIARTEDITAPKPHLTLIDQVTGQEYKIIMRDGSLTSELVTSGDEQ